MLADCHMHTSFSGDSDTPPINQINRAIELGLHSICITDHHDHDVISDINFELDIDNYMKTMKELQERFADKIEILIGIELGMKDDLAKYLTDLTSYYSFDYVIGSLHFIDGLDPYYPEYFEGKSERQCYERYFELLLTNMQLIDCYDSLGHLDYIVRYGPNQDKYFSYESYKDSINPILKKLIQDNKALECNSGGYRNGLGRPNPSTDILTAYKNLGGKLITIGSDAHTPDYMADEFDKVEQILKTVGFEEYQVYKNRKAISYKI